LKGALGEEGGVCQSGSGRVKKGRFDHPSPLPGGEGGEIDGREREEVFWGGEVAGRERGRKFSWGEGGRGCWFCVRLRRGE